MVAQVYIRTKIVLTDIAACDLEIQGDDCSTVFKLSAGSLIGLLEQMSRFPSPGAAIDALHERAALMEERNAGRM